MNPFELLCCLVIVALCLSTVTFFSGKLLRDFRILLSKTELDCFLENQRLKAVSRGRNVELFYSYSDKKLRSTVGDILEECLWNDRSNFRIRFNGSGSIAIISGSTTLHFEDKSVLTVQPVTGKVTY